MSEVYRLAHFKVNSFCQTVSSYLDSFTKSIPLIKIFSRLKSKYFFMSSFEMPSKYVRRKNEFILSGNKRVKNAKSLLSSMLCTSSFDDFNFSSRVIIKSLYEIKAVN